MRITGTVRVDMTMFVANRCLYFGDDECHYLWSLSPSSGPLNVEVNIGEANDVVWTERAVDSLAAAQSVAIVGDDVVGVEHAMAELQAQFEQRAA